MSLSVAYKKIISENILFSINEIKDFRKKLNSLNYECKINDCKINDRKKCWKKKVKFFLLKCENEREKLMLMLVERDWDCNPIFNMENFVNICLEKITDEIFYCERED